MKSNTFCILPWVQVATLTNGDASLCCVADKSAPINFNKHTIEDYWNSSYLRKIRKKMLRGDSISECKRCYEEEKNGFSSHRVVENSVWKNERLGEDLFDKVINNTSRDGKITNDVFSLDLRLGNTCNLECVMCQPRESSKWLKNAKELAVILKADKLKSEWFFKSKISQKKYEWYKNQKFWKDLEHKLDGLHEIILGGGEPLLVKEHISLLNSCVSSGISQNIHLRYHTNGTIFDRNVVELWQKFKKVELFVSVDGLGEVQEFHRYRSRWNEVKENLTKFDSIGHPVYFRFLYSVTAINVEHLPDFAEWVLEQKFKSQQEFNKIETFIHTGFVFYPEYLDIKILPIKTKKRITKKFEEFFLRYPEFEFKKFRAIIDLMNSEDRSDLLPLLDEYLRALVSVRKDMPIKFIQKFVNDTQNVEII